MGEIDLLVGLTARLASTPRLDEFVELVAREIVALGFGAVWIAALDEDSGQLATLVDITDLGRSPFAAPDALDQRPPLGEAFRERRMINVTDPAALRLDDDLGIRPFACGPLLGSGGRPVGALAVSAYRGAQPIDDALLTRGLLRAMIDQLGIAMQRARDATRLERLEANLGKAQAAIVRDARLKAIGELSAGVAHDLNNLCGLAMVAVEVGARSPTDALAVLPRIERATHAIRDLVGRLQRAGRPPSSELELARLPRIIEDLRVMLRPALLALDIQLDVELAEVPPVRCDPVLVLQVLLNLVLNARDALTQVPSDRRVITLRVRSDDGMVRLSVADTGPGIAGDVLERLFQPFTTTKQDGHLGLGLATSRTGLAQHGATIEARNAATGGAVFEVTLIAAPEPASVDAEAASPAPSPEPGTPADGVRILAIDDDPDVVYIIRAYLEPLGYEISTATSSAQALDAASSQPFDLVLCDIGMPKHSGPEVCRLMRETGYRGKFVLMTGWDSQSLSIEQRAAECEAMLKKPFLGADLIGVIDTVLGRERAEPSP